MFLVETKGLCESFLVEGLSGSLYTLSRARAPRRRRGLERCCRCRRRPSPWLFWQPSRQHKTSSQAADTTCSLRSARGGRSLLRRRGLAGHRAHRHRQGRARGDGYGACPQPLWLVRRCFRREEDLGAFCCKIALQGDQSDHCRIGDEPAGCTGPGELRNGPAQTCSARGEHSLAPAEAVATCQLLGQSRSGCQAKDRGCLATSSCARAQEQHVSDATRHRRAAREKREENEREAS